MHHVNMLARIPCRRIGTISLRPDVGWLARLRFRLWWIVLRETARRDPRLAGQLFERTMERCCPDWRARI